VNLTAPLINVCPQSGLVSFNYGGTREQMRARILEFKDALIAAAGTPDYPTEHLLCDGMYTRKLFIPRGTVMVGKIHLKDCVNVVAKGDISLLTEFGTKRVQAGATAVSRAGTMKVGYAHEDTVFLNVFRTDKTDIAEIEAEIACEDFARIEQELTCR
jgi:hypothetical protein